MKEYLIRVSEEELQMFCKVFARAEIVSEEMPFEKIKQIAKQAFVSPQTVKAVIANPKQAKSNARKRALAALTEGGMVTHHIGKQGFPPYGYRRTPSGEIEQEEKEQEIIAKVRALHSEGHSTMSIAHVLGPVNRRGGFFDRSTISRMLRKDK